MWQPIKCVYGVAQRTPPKGTPVDNGRILPHFPQPNGYGPWWTCYPLLWTYDWSGASLQNKARRRCGMPPSVAISWQRFPMPRDKLEDIAWNKPNSKTLECLVWSVYDGIPSPEPTLKLTGPESYNQVTRHLANKVFRGLQVCCPTHTSAQFDEPTPVKVCSVVFATPPSGMPKSRRPLRPWTRLPINSTL